MATYKVFLIEDEEEHAGEILSVLEKLAGQRKNTDNCFQFSLIKGTVEEVYESRKYFFYEPKVIEKLQNKYEELLKEDGVYMGILLDTMLTMDDISGSLKNYYPSVELAKKIFFEFRDKIPVYIITANSRFEKQCERLMGVDLSQQYILKSDLLHYQIKEDIERMFCYYEERNNEIEGREMDNV